MRKIVSLITMIVLFVLMTSCATKKVQVYIMPYLNDFDKKIELNIKKGDTVKDVIEKISSMSGKTYHVGKYKEMDVLTYFVGHQNDAETMWVITINAKNGKSGYCADFSIEVEYLNSIDFIFVDKETFVKYSSR